MSLVFPEETQNNFELTPAGTYIATCYRIIDLGTQKNEYQGKINFHHQIIIGWELTDEKMSDGKPFAMQKFYNLSSNEKSTLRIDLESWRGKPFSKEDFGNFKLENLLGKPCLMGIVHENKNGKIKAKISSILKLPKNMPPPLLINPILRFDLSEFDQVIYDSLSEFCKQKISQSPEYAEIKNPTGEKPHIQVPADLDDEIPF